jgi:hypothetical protein
MEKDPIMRLMLSLLIFAVLIWSAYWFWGAQKNKTRLTDWIFEQRAEGWVMEFESLDQLGYPNRFDITLSKPSISTSEGAITWQGAFLQDLRLSYNPSHAIIVFPPSQNFMLGENRFQVSNHLMRASFVTGASRDHRIILEATGFEVASESFDIGFAQVQMAILQTADAHKVHLTLSGLKSSYQTTIENVTISANIETPATPNGFPSAIRNGLSTRFTNLKMDIDGKAIIVEGTVTVSSDLAVDGHIFTGPDIATGINLDDKNHINRLQIENAAKPFGIKVSQTPY